MGKMGEESRKSLRFECPIPAELVNLDGKDELIDKITAHDFSAEGLKLVISFKFNPGSNMDLKLFLPEKKLNIRKTEMKRFIILLDSRLRGNDR